MFNCSNKLCMFFVAVCAFEFLYAFNIAAGFKNYWRGVIVLKRLNTFCVSVVAVGAIEFFYTFNITGGLKSYCRCIVVIECFNFFCVSMCTVGACEFLWAFYTAVCFFCDLWIVIMTGSFWNILIGMSTHAASIFNYPIFFTIQFLDFSCFVIVRVVFLKVFKLCAHSECKSCIGRSNLSVVVNICFCEQVIGKQLDFWSVPEYASCICWSILQKQLW